MPCYNAGKYVSEAIESVLGQTYQDIELIITDDCSSDESLEIINNYKCLDDRIRIIAHSNNVGVSRSRNEAMALSTGEFIAFCDADDIWEKDKLKIQCEFFRFDESCSIIHSDSLIIDERGAVTGERFSNRFNTGEKLSGNVFQNLCLRNFINTPTVIFRKKCINDAGLFDEEFKYLEDWLYWIKLAVKYKFLYINEPLARYRMHSQSTRFDRKGYANCRIMGFQFILDNFQEIPAGIRSRLLYGMGRNYDYLGQPQQARQHYISAFKENKLNFKNLIRLLQSLIPNSISTAG